jgi:hypothetical protein
MERDEVYVPATRSKLGLTPKATEHDYDDLLGDTPVYTLFMLVRQQILAFPAYLRMRYFPHTAFVPSFERTSHERFWTSKVS